MGGVRDYIRVPRTPRDMSNTLGSEPLARGEGAARTANLQASVTFCRHFVLT